MPIGEVQAKAAISQQTKGTNLAEAKTASAGRTAKDTTSAVTNQAIATQLAAKGIDYNKLNKVQQQDTYVDVIVQMSAAPASKMARSNPITPVLPKFSRQQIRSSRLKPVLNQPLNK